MAEIINFKQAKKRLNQSEKEKRAEQNRARFGRTKAEKQLDANEAAKAEKSLDQHKLDD